MAFAKKKVYITPIGSAEPYSYINKPDFGGVGFENPRGTYKVDLTLDNSECQHLVDLIVKTHEENYAERLEQHKANPPEVKRGKKPLEPYEGDMPFIDNGDGTTTFKFKCYGSFQDKKTGENKAINLSVVDSKGKRIVDVPLVGGGSQLKVRFSLVPYGWSNVAGASVKLQLEGVMVVELASFGGGDDDWGDETVDGGYQASEQSRASTPSNSAPEPEPEVDEDDNW